MHDCLQKETMFDRCILKNVRYKVKPLKT